MSDYIMNRESLKRHCEAVCKKFKDVPTSGTYGEHRLVLDLLEQTEWIPISEREPTTASHVLVSTVDGVVCEVDYAVMKHDAYENTLINIFLESIVAWMPLPKPYKAEKVGEYEK